MPDTLILHHLLNPLNTMSVGAYIFHESRLNEKKLSVG